jgi:Replication protein
MADQEGRSPDLGQEVRASRGIDSLVGRVARYGAAKAHALAVAESTRSVDATIAGKVADCGSYLLFRHYYRVDELRLHAASFCKKHLLCSLCAIRRGAKMVQAYMARTEAVLANRPHLTLELVTLTVRDGADLAERFDHLHRCQRELWKQKQRGRGSVLDGVESAVWSYEVKRGAGSGLWHPHLHMVAMVRTPTDALRLRDEWFRVTGDSFVVDTRPMTGAVGDNSAIGGFLEVFKYAVKVSSMAPEDAVHAWQVLQGRRLIGSAGRYRGIVVPDDLADEALDDEPFTLMLYRYLAHAGGYTLQRGQTGARGMGAASPHVQLPHSGPSASASGCR